MGRHRGRLVHGGGLPRLYPSLTHNQEQRGQGRSWVLPMSSLTSACQEVGRPSQTAPGGGWGREAGTMPASRRTPQRPLLSAPIPSIFQMPPLAVVVSGSLHRGASGASSMFPGGGRGFLGPEIHSLQLPLVTVKASRSPFPFILSSVHVTVSRLPLCTVVSRSYFIFHGSLVRMTVSRPLLPLLMGLLCV